MKPVEPSLIWKLHFPNRPSGFNGFPSFLMLCLSMTSSSSSHANNKSWNCLGSENLGSPVKIIYTPSQNLCAKYFHMKSLSLCCCRAATNKHSASFQNEGFTSYFCMRKQHAAEGRQPTVVFSSPPTWCPSYLANYVSHHHRLRPP